TGDRSRRSSRSWCEMAGRRKLMAMAEEVERHLRAARDALRRPLETAYAEGGLTGPQRSVMGALVRSPGMSLKELSRAVGLSHSAVSSITHRLERRGLERRKGDPEDRRITRIVVADAVVRFVREQVPMLTLSPIVAALGSASGREREKVIEGLRILR